MCSDQSSVGTPCGALTSVLMRVEEEVNAASTLAATTDATLTEIGQVGREVAAALGQVHATLEALRCQNEAALTAVLRRSYRYCMAMIIGCGLVAALAVMAYTSRPDAVTLYAVLGGLIFTAIGGIAGAIIDNDVQRNQIELLRLRLPELADPQNTATQEVRNA